MEAMRRGDFAAAWAISDAIVRRGVARDPTLPRHLQALWDGRPLAGQRVLVHCYHGLGDTLQYVRLLPLLRAQVRHVTLWVQPALLGLLHAVAGSDRLLPLHDGVLQIERDADIELMELPHYLRLAPDDIPAGAPYIEAPATNRGRHCNSRLRVGLVWRAGDWDVSRSIPAQLLKPLGELQGIDWVSLQWPSKAMPFRAADLACRDVRTQASLMLSLDLVVCVDTFIAHLSGALGLSTWLLLPTPCDWRWMTGREDSPWYPTMRLFRQTEPGDWSDVVDRVARALCAAVASRAAVASSARV